MTGTGAFAELIKTRFELARRKLGFSSADDRHGLNTSAFRRPDNAQLSLDW